MRTDTYWRQDLTGRMETLVVEDAASYTSQTTWKGDKEFIVGRRGGAHLMDLNDANRLAVAGTVANILAMSTTISPARSRLAP